MSNFLSNSRVDKRVEKRRRNFINTSFSRSIARWRRWYLRAFIITYSYTLKNKFVIIVGSIGWNFNLRNDCFFSSKMLLFSLYWRKSPQNELNLTDIVHFFPSSRLISLLIWLHYWRCERTMLKIKKKIVNIQTSKESSDDDETILERFPRRVYVSGICARRSFCLQNSTFEEMRKEKTQHKWDLKVNFAGEVDSGAL